MGLFSKLRKKRGKVKFSDNFFYNPRREKLRRFFDKKIQADLAKAKERGGFAGSIPMPISGRMGRINRLFGDTQFRDPNVDFRKDFADFSIRSGRSFRPGGDGQLIPVNGQEPRLGFGLKSLLPRIKDKVPLAPAFSGMPIPQMVGEPQMLPQPIPRVPVEENISEISDSGFGMPDPRMNMMEPRMMMAEGFEADKEDYDAATDSLVDFLNSDPEQVAFGRQVGGALAYDDGVIQITEKELDDYSKNYLARNREMASALGLTVDDIRAQSLEAIRRMKEGPLMEGGKYNPSENPRRVPEFAAGDEVKPDFLDFDNDGDKEESMKQALQQKNKMAEGDEVSMMLMEMDEPAEMPEEEMEDVDMLMAEVADVAPAAQMLDEYVNMVVEMIQAGASEAEIIQMLVEAGLDEEDINAVFQAVLEMLEGQSIDSELAALG